MSKIPWQDKPENSNDVMWRYSENPIIDRYAIPTSNSIFNSLLKIAFGLRGVMGITDLQLVLAILLILKNFFSVKMLFYPLIEMAFYFLKK